MMNEDIAKGKWTQIKGEIQKTWGKITGDELEQTKGDMKSIAGLVQERYGLAKEDADRRLSELSERFADKASRTTEEVKEKLERSNENARSKKM
jgi:uncharacterized protein YjbJ (UPF0337 family)